jgi:hypothetical protein
MKEIMEPTSNTTAAVKQRELEAATVRAGLLAMADGWPKLDYLISELAHDWERLNEFAEDLSITDILIGHVRPQQRFLLDRWLSTDPRRSDPEKRTGFKHEELLIWVSANRAALLRALLTLVRAWVVAGQPDPKGVAIFGGFSRWVRRAPPPPSSPSSPSPAAPASGASSASAGPTSSVPPVGAIRRLNGTIYAFDGSKWVKKA